MAEVVEANLRESGAFEEPREGAVSQVRGIYDAASLVREDQAAGPIKEAHLLLLFALAREGARRASRTPAVSLTLR